MTFFYIVLFLCILFSSKYQKETNEGYLEKQSTDIIKGIFIFLVFIRHFFQYDIAFRSDWIDQYARGINKCSGQLIVVMFLFYSGYGVMVSYQKKGKTYVDQMPSKRILTTLFHFDVAVVLYMLVAIFLKKKEFSVLKCILSLLGWNTYGNSNWYIFCILIMYIVTYLALKFFPENKAVYVIFAGGIVYTLLLSYFKDTYWYNTVFCYVFGCFYAVKKEKIENLIRKRENGIFVFLLAVFYLTLKFRKNLICYDIMGLVFVGIILLITRKIVIKNNFFEWTGKNLFPLYIYQRLPMILLCQIDFFKIHPHIFFAAVIVLTILIAVLYNEIQKLLKKMVTVWTAP